MCLLKNEVDVIDPDEIILPLIKHHVWEYSRSKFWDDAIYSRNSADLNVAEYIGSIIKDVGENNRYHEDIFKIHISAVLTHMGEKN